MKIRQGFVSNSSSSSFMIYGAIFSSLDSQVVEAFEEAGLEVYCPFDDDYYIGMSWDGVGDNETGGEFKKRVENTIRNVKLEKGVEFVIGKVEEIEFPDLTHLSFMTHSESWYNG